MGKNDKNSIIEPVKIISDHPEIIFDKISFGFEHYVGTLSELIANKENATPLVIGVYGDWGTGKTTLMRNIQGHLDNGKYNKEKWSRKCKTIWFEPWKYEKEDEILAALIETIFKEMQKDGFFGHLKSNIEKITKNINIKGFFSEFIKQVTLGTVNLDKLFSDEDYKARLAFYDNFDLLLNRLIFAYLSFGFQEEGEYQEWDDKKGSLVIFIDDLDRCPPERILKVLETIKLFMDKKGCVFVIGADKNIIENAVKLDGFKDYYKKFMDKIINVVFKLPKIHENDFENYLKNIKKDFSIDLTEYSEIIIPMMNNNPRNLKRFINDINLRYNLLQKKGLKIELKHLIIWEIISDNFPYLKDVIIKNKATETFNRLKVIMSIYRDTNIEEKDKEKKLEPLRKDIDDKLHDFFIDPVKAKLIESFDCDDEQIEQLETLKDIFDSSEPEILKDDLYKNEIGDMVKIPKGKLLFKHDQKEISIALYEIGIFPVTNQEYAKFIKEGYKEEKYWRKYGGWEWKLEYNIENPRYWDHPVFNGPIKPVVGVSFYEAGAYCEWLSGKTGLNYRLPNEKEWEKAARGTDGRRYPWGNDFDKNKCNTIESGRKKTNDVNLFTNGRSPFGCYDMEGNVWEWTSTIINDFHVMRGGSWRVNLNTTLTTRNNKSIPEDQDNVNGFRISRDPVPSMGIDRD